MPRPCPHDILGHPNNCQQCLNDTLRAKVAELERENSVIRGEAAIEVGRVKLVCLEYRDALSRLFDHAAEVRLYADGWEWKYGEEWDEEMTAAREVLEPKP